MKDKVAIVTGAGSGIGRAIAEALSAKGASVVVAEIDAAKGRKAVEGIRSNNGIVHLCECDVTRVDQVQSMVDFSLSELGRVDILVNNAICSIDDIHSNSWRNVEFEKSKGPVCHYEHFADDGH